MKECRPKWPTSKEKNDAFQDEHFEVGDEAGVQSRFTLHFGEELGRIFEAQGIDVNFSDFKCLGLGYENTSDSVLKTQSPRHRSRRCHQGGAACLSPPPPGQESRQGRQGRPTTRPRPRPMPCPSGPRKRRRRPLPPSIKVPWIEAHRPSRAYEDENALRRLLAQPVQYMQDLGCAYGFYTTYDETMFLRQILVNGMWEIQYSPCVFAGYFYQETSLLTPSIVSVKRCFLYVASLARQ
ncbi:unnamed protein product [Penicillium salamii]|nr:unnamed protein product [Penicillium salamii]